MNENLNLVEILKDVPVGTELYSSLFGTVTFEKIDLSNKNYPVLVADSGGNLWGFNSDGKYYSKKDGECLLFPSRENRDWSTFSIFKPGDFVYRELTSIFVGTNEWISIHKAEEDGGVFSFVDWNKNTETNDMFIGGRLCSLNCVIQQRKATPKEKQLLTQTMLEQGYIFDEESCTLVKLQPGTFLKVEASCEWYTIFKEIKKGILFSYTDLDPLSGTLWKSESGLCYLKAVKNIRLATPEEVDFCMKCFKEEGLVWNKDLLSLTEIYEDEVEFKPFQQVLVRDGQCEPWRIEFFSHMGSNPDYPYICSRGPFKYCISFEGNEDKLGKV